MAAPRPPPKVVLTQYEGEDFCSIAGLRTIFRVQDTRARELAAPLPFITPSSHPEVFQSLPKRRGAPPRRLYPLDQVLALALQRDEETGSAVTDPEPARAVASPAPTSNVGDVDRRVRDLEHERDQLRRENARLRALAADIAKSVQRYVDVEA